VVNVTIYVYLPQEKVDVWAPVSAEYVRDDIYRIVDCRGEDEAVEFGKGSLVRCRWQDRSDGRIRVAFEEVE
jgi:hypothetical protein